MDGQGSDADQAGRPGDRDLREVDRHGNGVDAEVEIAREEEKKKPYFLLAGRADAAGKKAKAALSTDKIYDWTWDNLEKLIGGAW